MVSRRRCGSPSRCPTSRNRQTLSLSLRQGRNCRTRRGRRPGRVLQARSRQVQSRPARAPLPRAPAPAPGMGCSSASLAVSPRAVSPSPVSFSCSDSCDRPPLGHEHDRRGVDGSTTCGLSARSLQRPGLGVRRCDGNCAAPVVMTPTLTAVVASFTAIGSEAAGATSAAVPESKPGIKRARSSRRANGVAAATSPRTCWRARKRSDSTDECDTPSARPSSW